MYDTVVMHVWLISKYIFLDIERHCNQSTSNGVRRSVMSAQVTGGCYAIRNFWTNVNVCNQDHVPHLRQFLFHSHFIEIHIYGNNILNLDIWCLRARYICFWYLNVISNEFIPFIKITDSVQVQVLYFPNRNTCNLHFARSSFLEGGRTEKHSLSSCPPKYKIQIHEHYKL